MSDSSNVIVKELKQNQFLKIFLQNEIFDKEENIYSHLSNKGAWHQGWAVVVQPSSPQHQKVMTQLQFLGVPVKIELAEL